MAITKERGARIRNYLKEHKIAVLDDLKKVVGSDARITVLRTLKTLDYLSSYSHRGQYYTLFDIPDFNELGLWSFKSVQFSKLGNLLTTARAMVERADAGYTCQELEDILGVEVRHTLLDLHRKGKIHRLKIEGRNVYLSRDKARQRQQRLWRENSEGMTELGLSSVADVFADELKAAIILFYSMLNEQQRRLFAGLEALKLGYGGDKIVAQLLGLDVHTVSKGRNELVGQDIEHFSRLRQGGGGRKKAEKKIQK